MFLPPSIINKTVLPNSQLPLTSKSKKTNLDCILVWLFGWLVGRLYADILQISPDLPVQQNFPRTIRGQTRPDQTTNKCKKTCFHQKHFFLKKHIFLKKHTFTKKTCFCQKWFSQKKTCLHQEYSFTKKHVLSKKTNSPKNSFSTKKYVFTNKKNVTKKHLHRKEMF